jgi:hypothetical protein
MTNYSLLPHHPLHRHFRVLNVPVLHGNRHARTAVKPGNAGVFNELGKLGLRRPSLINLFSSVGSHAWEYTISRCPNLERFLCHSRFFSNR